MRCLCVTRRVWRQVQGKIEVDRVTWCTVAKIGAIWGAGGWLGTWTEALHWAGAADRESWRAGDGAACVTDRLWTGLRLMGQQQQQQQHVSDVRACLSLDAEHARRSAVRSEEGSKVRAASSAPLLIHGACLRVVLPAAAQVAGLWRGELLRLLYIPSVVSAGWRCTARTRSSSTDTSGLARAAAAPRRAWCCW